MFNNEQQSLCSWGVKTKIECLDMLHPGLHQSLFLYNFLEQPFDLGEKDLYIYINIYIYIHL